MFQLHGMLQRTYIHWIAIIIFGGSTISVGQSTKAQISKISDSVVDSSALTIQGAFGQAINGKSFQQEAIVTHHGLQYVAYYNGARKVCLARRELPDGPWHIIVINDYDFKSNDAHNTISMGICPNDATIHLAFDHHGDTLHYIRSIQGAAGASGDSPWTADLFGPVHSDMEQGKSIKITYPRFWQTPTGGLQFCYRRGGSGHGDRMMVDYDPVTELWHHTRQIDSGSGFFQDNLGTSRSRCSYPNGYSYGPSDDLHTTWVWREDSQGANHDLMYARSSDGGITWMNNAGAMLSEPPHVNSKGIQVFAIGRAYGLMNTHGQVVDAEGRVHVVMWHCSATSLRMAGSKPGEHRWGPPEARRYHHYWRSVDGEWTHEELPGVAGSRPKIVADEASNLYLMAGTSNQYAEGSDLIIMTATKDKNWTDWRLIHQERGPFVNEMITDPTLWKQQGVLSVMVQESPRVPHASTPLRILDFAL